MAPMIPSRDGVRRTSTLRYHLLWEGHHEGITVRMVSFGKSISMPPAEFFMTRPPDPRSSPFAPSVVKSPSTRSWRPLGSGTPLMFGSYVTRCAPTRAATAVLRLTHVDSPV